MEMYFKRMKDEWTGLVEQADPLIRAKAAEIAVAHAHYLSIEFYRIVRIDPHAEEFLSNEQVERQLKSAMERWIINVLSAQVDDVERLIQIQHTVAEVHARIGIPVEIVEMGFRVLKKILYPVIFSSDYSAAEKLQVYHFSINSIDIAMEVMTRAFTFSDSSASKEDENYRIFSLLENAEEEKERQIASLLSWEIDIIYKVLLDSDLGSSLPLSQADFGLWFNHKGRHYFSGIAEVGHMMGAVLINENDEVMFFNPAAEKLWGYKREEVIGNNIDMLIPRDLRPAHPEYIRHNREGGKARVEGMSRELQLEKKDGSKIWTRFALSKVSAEGKIYYLALVRDASVEMAQKEQTRQLIIAVDHLDRPVIVLDPERHIVQCNRAFTEMFGYCISEASGMQPDSLLNIPEFPADNRIRLQQLLWKTARDQDEFLLLTRTGEKIWIKASISPVYDVLAHLQNLVMTFSDITEERQIRQLEGNILAAMCSSPPFHEMGEIICRNIESVLNESHVSLFALRNGMPIHWASSSHGAEVQNAQSWSATIRQRDGAPAGILQIKTSSGAETSAFIERVADISQHMAALALEQEKSRQHIEQLIQFDPMTGLPNRNNLHNYLDDLVDKAVSPVVYLISVDHIQDVIDSLGYAWADQALLEVVNRFREKLKPDQYLCRIEGTQFVLVSLENDVSNITQIADELRNVVSKPIMIDDKPFPLTLSIGISYDVGKNRDYLLSTAHNAMDFIRKNGGNGWQFFSPAMNEMVKERLVLGAALKEAISNNQLKLVYQPQIFAETGELYGIEALARWHDPLHGHVPPSRFIPLAEEIGEIENIGRWVIAEACRQLAEWRSQNIHIPALSVNLSALHFRSNQLPNQVSDAMHAWGIDGHQLTVEITESMMMEHDTEIFKRIQILRDMGVGLSVDDFGTGFSGLSRLVSLPVTEIKIDKSFVDRCLTEKRILALLEAITSIGQSLNLTVVAEGVETKEQFEMLRKIHCRVIQGYFFSRPLPAEEIPGWMSSVLPLKI
ncbi:TPA: oxygen-sensing cyclic-di-GMP phosphodiesterase [Escherichia coli]|nr:oxygen-sensing cyclic-di-GMP phosphodiesterase [Escherichia coli]EII4856014.1 oxygen-sensing cyclic-di-GMP phosphodiesterase [Escherichia coli]EIQ9234190.1 oxygen-sensing cyclic-di-GMP phosphodiesterase [Escherichia coli]EIX4565056.1 oxygen-sensing cyclic-di-GMP phosphodiesterase [Escherichia coli]EKP7836842.1 oxygen-sensing cyclic-di-GMP phosphodiesterase [Escherichia coli]